MTAVFLSILETGMEWIRNIRNSWLPYYYDESWSCLST